MNSLPPPKSTIMFGEHGTPFQAVKKPLLNPAEPQTTGSRPNFREGVTRSEF
jgi:hypothetical protein